MIFAFGRSEDPGTYFISHGVRSYSHNLSVTLTASLRASNDPPLQALAFGEGDTWFYKESPRVGSNGTYCVSAATGVYYPRVREIFDSGEVMNWVAFGDNGQFIVDTEKHIYSNTGIPRTYESNGNQVPLRCASFGHKDTWVCVEEDGEIRSNGLSPDILQALSRKAVRNVQLSGVDQDSIFIEYVDGDTLRRLPDAWHADVSRIEAMEVQEDQPGTWSGPSISQNIVVAFGHQSDVFCISKEKASAWSGIGDPAVLEKLNQPGAVDAFSLGEGGACFWSQNGMWWASSQVAMTYPKVWQVLKSGEKVDWVAFGPYGYYAMSTRNRLRASKHQIILRNYADSGMQVPLRCASFGYGGSWVVVENDGVIRSYGLTETVLAKLHERNVRAVQLSIVNPDNFFIEYMDGTFAFELPDALIDTVRQVVDVTLP